MSYTPYPKRDAIKNYFPVPNEVYLLGLKPTELSIYGYLLRIEDRRTFDCYPSYGAIAKAVNVSKNTVRKYVSMLEDRGLIKTEPTTVTHKDGTKWNGALRYHIRPVQEALNRFYEKQQMKLDMQAEQRRTLARMEKSGLVGERTELCAPFRSEASHDTNEAV